MSKLNENTIEQSLIDQLISQGYTYFNGKDIVLNGNNPQRENFASVLLEQHFKNSLKKLYFKSTSSTITPYCPN